MDKKDIKKWLIVLAYILGCIAIVAIAMWITKAVWESNLPTWLKIFILR